MNLDKQALKKLTACLSYGTVSVSMTLFNKAVFSIYQFNYPSFGKYPTIFVPNPVLCDLGTRPGFLLSMTNRCVQSPPCRSSCQLSTC